MQQINMNIIYAFIISAIYIALITFQPSLQFMPKNIVWFLDKQRLLELLLLSFVLVHSICTGLNNSNVTQANKPLCFSLAILLIFTCFSISLSFQPRHALIEASVFAGLSYLALHVAQLYQEEKIVFIQRLIYVIWAGILLYMLSFYVGYLTATIVKEPLHWPFPFVGFSNIRAFNQYQLWSIGLVLLPLLCFELRKTTRIFLHIALCAWWVLLFYSASRGVLFAWLIGMCLTGLVYQKLSLPFLRLQLINCITGFISYQILFKLTPTLNSSVLVTQSIARQTTYDRLALWDQAMLMIKSYPVFGVGPMHYAWFNRTNGHPHNSILQLAAEWGLPATILILLIFAYGFYHWFKKFNRTQLRTQSKQDSSLTIILFFTIITNAAYSLVDGVIVMPISQVLMSTMIGLMLGQYVLNHNTPINYKPRLRPWIAALLLIVMAWSTYPELKQGFSGDRKSFSMGHTAIGPRFWRETK